MSATPSRASKCGMARKVNMVNGRLPQEIAKAARAEHRARGCRRSAGLSPRACLRCPPRLIKARSKTRFTSSSSSLDQTNKNMTITTGTHQPRDLHAPARYAAPLGMHKKMQLELPFFFSPPPPTWVFGIKLAVERVVAYSLWVTCHFCQPLHLSTPRLGGFRNVISCSWGYRTKNNQT